MPLTFDPNYLMFAVEDKPWQDTAKVKLSRHQIGILKIVSGKLLATDPGYLSFEEPAFEQPIPIGDFPVMVTIAQFNRNNDQRITFATIRITDTKPTRWDMNH